ncbi:hypothetical protein AciX9_4696 (plasmid) [Granulicella tundricola MP5ACTX9]|uniref:Uncharacterized protein n=1 Tax=Granulicella tundricola (strain ATCC BAA-1859 / DSM 23138 / MP5ACTX9) TaxID=1198114 RepID=E8X839_GRATM|nr:hypothetical protein AciX9_4696 [Granulicella tundricola MP5ACTX9]
MGSRLTGLFAEAQGEYVLNFVVEGSSSYALFPADFSLLTADCALLSPNPAFFSTDAMHLLRGRRELHLFVQVVLSLNERRLLGPENSLLLTQRFQHTVKLCRF